MNRQSCARISSAAIAGVILAGGRGQRLGGVDKGLAPFRGRPLIEYAIAALRPQVSCLMISANRNQQTYAAYGFPVIADTRADYCGPLAGILSALHAADKPFLLSVPCDAPALSPVLVERLAAALAGADAGVSVAFCDGKMQPVFCLMRCTLAESLQEYLHEGGRTVGQWMRRQQAVMADFSDTPEAFENINTREILERLEMKRPGVEENPADISGGSK